MKKRFALIGAAGFVAPRHMAAIKNTGNEVLVALDPFDSVGIIDSYFPNAHFFTEFERFDRHIDKCRRKGEGHAIDFVSICSPNYLHDAHTRFSLRSDCDAICEKPLVLNPWNLDGIERLESETGKRLYTILQLRLHPSIVALKERIDRNRDKKYEVDLSYVTSRGSWYSNSWKGLEEKSGGITMNIGIHFFDMLLWLFGDVQESFVYTREGKKASGFLELESARVRWFLSIDQADIPEEILAIGQRTFRSITVDENEVEFSSGFTDLHTTSYEHILTGGGFSVKDARPSIELVYKIRKSKITQRDGDNHPIGQA